jgi:hypothetical protein
VASHTISGQAWPDGTTVGVYPAVAVPANSDVPSGSTVTTGVVAGGSVRFDNLSEKVRYYAYAAGVGRRFVIADAVRLSDRARIEALESVVVSDGPIDAQHPDFGVRGDGSTDDAAALQRAIAAATAAGRPLFVPAGTYAISSLSVPTGLELYGDGERTIFKVLGTAQYPFVNAVTTGWANVYLHDFAVDGNKAAIAGDPDVNGNPDATLMLSSADATPASNIVVERVSVRNAKRLGIVLQNVQGGAVRECIVEDNERDGITLYSNCKRVEITGNRVSRCSDDYIAINSENGTSTGHLCEQILVARNILVGPGGRNKGKGIMVRGGRALSITGNVIESVSESGIHIANYNTTNTEDVTVSANTIRDTGLNGTAAKNGVLLDSNNAIEHASSTYAAIRRVTIANNTITATRADAIALRNNQSTEGQLERVTITGNTITGPTGVGIAIAGSGAQPIVDVTIAGNQVVAATSHGISANAAGHKRLWLVGNATVSNGGDGCRLDTVTDCAVMSYVTVSNTANGITITNCAGRLAIRPGLATGNATNIVYTGLASTQFRESFFSAGDATRPVVSGAKGSNAALASLMTALNGLGLVSDTTSA